LFYSYMIQFSIFPSSRDKMRLIAKCRFTKFAKTCSFFAFQHFEPS
jgi:hypothetical protein